MRDRTSPEYLFGWRASAWPEMSDQIGLKGAAEMDATFVWANLEEDVLAIGYGLPKTALLPTLPCYEEPFALTFSDPGRAAVRSPSGGFRGLLPSLRAFVYTVPVTGRDVAEKITAFSLDTPRFA